MFKIAVSDCCTPTWLPETKALAVVRAAPFSSRSPAGVLKLAVKAWTDGEQPLSVRPAP